MSEESARTDSLPGARLRRERESRGLSIAQASSELHVDQRLLTALENDDYAALGAPIFVKGHLRNYARLLGLDPGELIAEYEAAQQPTDPTLTAHRPEGTRMDEHRSPAWLGWFGWVFLLVLGLLLAAWWWYQQEGGANFVISNEPARVELPVDEPATADENQRFDAFEEQGAVTAPEPGADGETALASDASRTPPGTENDPPQEGDQQAETPVQQTTPNAQTSSPAATRPAAPAGARGLTLEFTQESWVEIYDAEGRPILYDLLGPGARREINATGQLRVFLGNADGVEVFVGGQPFNLDRHRRSDSTARFTVNVPSAN